MQTSKKTKIVCTIGPASWDESVLKEMVKNGMNVARINGAFADLAELERVEKTIRGISDDVALMLDIKGHEVRLNKFEEFTIKPGDIVEIGVDPSSKVFPITFPQLHNDIPVGSILVVDDGNVEMSVKSKKADGTMVCEVLYGEKFKPGKSINTPGIHVSNPALTERDKEQMKFCAEQGWEFVAASFIRTKHDAQVVVDQVKGTCMKVIAKIEDQQGVDNLDDILELVYGVMVARGDLGVEVPFERIPLIQKKLIWKTTAVGKPVITATQMLESMTNNPRPTRAEITDVANAIIDGTDAVMLSGESSTGKYPAQAVLTMSKIAREIEPNLSPEAIYDRPQAPAVIDALTKAAFQLAYELEDEIKAIIVVSEEGESARLLGRFRLPQPIYAFVSADIFRRHLSLSRGINQAFTFNHKSQDRDNALKNIMKEVVEKELVHKHDKVLILGGGLMASSFFPNIFEVVNVEDFSQ